ncbi:tryptophan 7-halogenase [Ulvibacter litoralis]|uniref:Dehydrogenase (Flavoprotein) n=1 Tax=Ulvibacter litoralis TaxID=227084 RepID=A0A1G7HGY0_9FLAO|nr:tryptophan 7-halogenase [Ulvibacter litoralis]GHC57778.1 hypothetical protein GCM10008083_23000 [Ulvibacter litoralis]SDE99757.1 Dehydrogenase (flavoprotein) [Ulvibacter litoralis]
MKDKTIYTIAIIGAGPAGSSCAIALLKAGFKVQLLDNSKTGKFHIGESIPPDMNLLLKKLGVYDSFLAETHEPCYGSCSYWGSELRGYNDSLLNPYGHGWHLDRQNFNQFLVEEAEKLGATIFRNCTYKSSVKTESGYQLFMEVKKKQFDPIEADFVIDASGTRSVFASEYGSTQIKDTSLVCLGVRFRNKGGREVSKLTHLESVENGWWYAARIPGEQLLVTLYTTSEVVKTLELHHLENWVKLLQQAPNTSHWIRGMEPVESKLIGFKAPSFCLSRVVGDSWMAIGDAAICFDPITSQGIIKSVTQGIRAAEIITHYVSGIETALPYFETEVKAQYKQYLESRKYFYHLEKRWPTSAFWKTIQDSTSQREKPT